MFVYKLRCNEHNLNEFSAQRSVKSGNNARYCNPDSAKKIANDGRVMNILKKILHYVYSFFIFVYLFLLTFLHQ